MRLYICIFLLLISCNNQDQLLPSSTGSDSEIIFLASDDIWQDKIKDLVLKVFEKPIEGLGREEPAFNILRVDKKQFNLLLKRHTNIVIIDSNIKSIKIKHNQWAKEQMVAYINWNQHDLKNLETLRGLYDKFKKKELKKLRIFHKKESWGDIENKLKLNFGIDVIVPKKYTIIQDTDDFFWASYNPAKSEEIKQLLIFSFRPKTANISSEILTKLDSVFSKHLKGPKENTYVKIERRYSPYYSNNTYRGIWKLENGFMGGPFLAKEYFINNKIIISSGLIFSPQSPKRKHIKELEVIL